VSLIAQMRLARAKRRCRFPLQAKLLHEPLPSNSDRISEIEVVALDFETTGLNPQTDHVIAAGWVLIQGERMLYASAREIRVRPHAFDGVGQSAVIHGIVDSDLDDAESLDALVEVLLPELAGRAIVAHAASIERAFLASMLRHLGGVPLPNPFIDTMTLEKRLVEGTGGRIRETHGDLTLEECRERRGLPDHNRHSAGSDAVACGELFLAQVAHLGGAGKVPLREVI
jgi:DNA polymerase-3 subunit epsilon